MHLRILAPSLRAFLEKEASPEDRRDPLFQDLILSRPVEINSAITRELWALKFQSFFIASDNEIHRQILKDLIVQLHDYSHSPVLLAEGVDANGSPVN